MLLDFKKAFLYADIERELYIELPEDDERRAGGQHVGRLNKAMCGTRDAPAAWSRLVRVMLSKLGFEACKTAASVFYHPGRKLQIVSHVDDFLCAGDASDLQWLRSQLREGYEVDGDILGLGDGESAEGKSLGRILRYTSGGIEWEADPTQATALIAEFGMEDCSGVDAPGVKAEVEVEEDKMTSGEASKT